MVHHVIHVLDTFGLLVYCIDDDVTVDLWFACKYNTVHYAKTCDYCTSTGCMCCTLRHAWLGSCAMRPYLCGPHYAFIRPSVRLSVLPMPAPNPRLKQLKRLKLRLSLSMSQVTCRPVIGPKLKGQGHMMRTQEMRDNVRIAGCAMFKLSRIMEHMEFDKR